MNKVSITLVTNTSVEILSHLKIMEGESTDVHVEWVSCLSPQHGTLSGYGWRRRLPGM
jgi:hypothetical protein